MHVLTNAEKLIPLRDAASLAESRRLAGMRMVTGTTSPSTRYERIFVSPASCSIKSEYVIASHAFKPQYKCINYTPAWEQRKLGDVASSFDYGLNAAATEYDGQNKYLRITDIDDETHEFSKSDLTTPLADLAMSADYLLKESDLLFARTGASVGKTYLYRQFDGMVYFAGFLIRARIGEGADPEFAYQATLTDAYKKYVAITSQRSGQPGVNAQEYADYQLMLPSKTEQQQIGMTLRSLDDLITLHQRKYDKLVVFKKSMLEKMFPKDGEPVPEIRFAGFTDPWEQRKFVDFVEASGIRNKDNLQLESYSVSNDRGFVPQDEQFENGGTMRDADKTAYWIVEPGSFAYNPARINVGSIGYQSTRKNVIVSSLYEVFKTDHSCDDRFLWHWFKSSLFTKQIEMLQEGGVRLYFFFDKLQKSEIWMPNVDEQRIIGQQFDQLDSLITLHQRKRESRIIRVRSFIWLAGDISGIGVSAYQPEKRRPYDRRQHQRRNVVLRLLRAMDQRIQGRCNS